MKDKKEAATKQKNAALDSFSHERPKGFMRSRFLAAVIDFVIIALVCQLVFVVFGAPDWGRYLQMQETVKGLHASDPLVLERMALYQKCFILTLATGAAYEALTLILLGASVGKLIFGLRVVNVKEGRSVYMSKLMLFLRALLKAFSIYLLSALPFVFLCLTSLGNSEGRSGFDIFAGTKVIKARGNRQ